MSFFQTNIKMCVECGCQTIGPILGLVHFHNTSDGYHNTCQQVGSTIQLLQRFGRQTGSLEKKRPLKIKKLPC
jgi:hypothetical protein